MEKSESIAELAAALAAAQAAMDTAKKDSSNPFFKSTYADLASVWDACRRPLTDNGLAVIQTTGNHEDKIIIETMLTHKSGQWVSSTLELTPKQNDPQSVGSAITYGRRYSLAAMVGVAPDEDDDGNAASGHTAEKPKQPAKPSPAQGGGEHWCAKHGTAFFKTKKGTYAHPIKANGETVGWCNEPAAEVPADIKPTMQQAVDDFDKLQSATADKPQAAPETAPESKSDGLTGKQVESVMPGQKLMADMAKANWKEATAIGYFRNTLKVVIPSGDNFVQAWGKLNEQQRAAFEQKMDEMAQASGR